jgi:hypothetical protein
MYGILSFRRRRKCLCTVFCRFSGKKLPKYDVLTVFLQKFAKKRYFTGFLQKITKIRCFTGFFHEKNG